MMDNIVKRIHDLQDKFKREPGDGDCIENDMEELIDIVYALAVEVKKRAREGQG